MIAMELLIKECLVPAMSDRLCHKNWLILLITYVNSVLIHIVFILCLVQINKKKFTLNKNLHHQQQQRQHLQQPLRNREKEMI